MSGEMIWVRGKDGRLRQERDLPDLCGNGHPTVFIQDSWCPTCSRESLVFRCRGRGCQWVVAIPRHYERGHCRADLATGTDLIRTQRLTRPHGDA